MHTSMDTADLPLSQHLKEAGYICLPLLSTEVCRALLDWHEQNQYALGVGFKTTLFSNNTDYRIQAHNLIVEALLPAIKSHLPDWVPVVGNFVAKDPSSSNSEVPLHQDWTFVDESHHRSLNVWCPLLDTDIENGTLQVVPGSHLVSQEPRGPGVPNVFMRSSAEIRHLLQSVPLKAGNAIIYDHALLHASSPNQSSIERVAIALTLVPIEAALRHCQAGSHGDLVDIFEVNQEFFKTHAVGKRPSSYPVIDSVKRPPELSLSPALLALLTDNCQRVLDEKASCL